jgi:hypothetical protein
LSVLHKIAYFQNRRDEIPNQELAGELIREQNCEGIGEIAENLWNKDKNIQNDCIKVLYEIGESRPELITPYIDDFFRLLKSKNNRMVWGAMTALAAIAAVKPEKIYENIDQIYVAMENGSVITIDNGIKALAIVAAQNQLYNEKISPFLIHHLQTCRPQEVPQHAEKSMPAVNQQNKADFLKVLHKRETDLSASQMVRIKKIYKAVARLGEDS